MALTNYTDLVASVKSWTHRQDLDAVIPDFVKLAEVRIAQDLNIQATEEVSTFSTVAGTESYNFPSDMVSLVRMWITDSGTDYELIGFNADLLDFETDVGRPEHYYVEANQFHLLPVADKAYTVSVTHKVTLNLQSTSTNNVMTKYPNIYLFATLIESAPYIGGDAMSKLSMYEQRYQQAIKDANRAENYQDHALLTTELSILNNHYSNINTI